MRVNESICRSILLHFFLSYFFVLYAFCLAQRIFIIFACHACLAVKPHTICIFHFKNTKTEKRKYESIIAGHFMVGVNDKLIIMRPQICHSFHIWICNCHTVNSHLAARPNQVQKTTNNTQTNNDDAMGNTLMNMNVCMGGIWNMGIPQQPHHFYATLHGGPKVI